ncbi:MAG: hypothetical protein ACRER2_16930 [Methylococcales bacterium]
MATLSSEDLEAMLETAIRNADSPLGVPAAIKALPVGKKPKKEPVQAGIGKLVNEGRIYAWPTNKFWRVDPASYAKEQVLEALSSGPLVEAGIKKKVPVCVNKLVKEALAALVKKGAVKAHPKLGKISPFGLDPPDVAYYLRMEIEAGFDRLRKLGFKSDELLRALRRHVGQAEPKCHGSPGDGEVILATMVLLNGQASRGALVYLKDLRAALSQRFEDKDSFDRAVLELAAQERVQLQSYAWPGRLSDAEKELLIPNGRGSYFDAIGIRLE